MWCWSRQPKSAQPQSHCNLLAQLHPKSRVRICATPLLFDAVDGLLVLFGFSVTILLDGPSLVPHKTARKSLCLYSVGTDRLSGNRGGIKLQIYAAKSAARLIPHETKELKSGCIVELQRWSVLEKIGWECRELYTHNIVFKRHHEN